MEADLQAAAAKEANKRPRRSVAQMEVERRQLHEKLSKEIQTTGSSTKKLTKIEMHALLCHAGVRIDFTESSAEHAALLRENLPEFAAASDAAQDGRSARRVVRELEYDDSDREVSDSDHTETESESDSDDKPDEQENKEESSHEDVTQFGLGCARCRWKASCATCRAWYDQGRRRIGERQWSKAPTAPRGGQSR